MLPSPLAILMGKPKHEPQRTGGAEGRQGRPLLPAYLQLGHPRVGMGNSPCVRSLVGGGSRATLSSSQRSGVQVGLLVHENQAWPGWLLLPSGVIVPPCSARNEGVCTAVRGTAAPSQVADSGKDWKLKTTSLHYVTFPDTAVAVILACLWPDGLRRGYRILVKCLQR